MRICTAPTIFDRLEREKLMAWLEQEPTIALMASLDARIKELSDYLCEFDIDTTDENVGSAYRVVRDRLDAMKQLRTWVHQAETRSREVQHGKA
jgi:hypothetical protein